MAVRGCLTACLLVELLAQFTNFGFQGAGFVAGLLDCLFQLADVFDCWYLLALGVHIPYFDYLVF